jgi:hypothetical protein
MNNLSLDNLERLNRAGKLHNMPKLQELLKVRRLEADAAKELEDLEFEPEDNGIRIQELRSQPFPGCIGIINIGCESHRLPQWVDESGVRWNFAAPGSAPPLCFMPRAAFESFRKLGSALDWLNLAHRDAHPQGSLFLPFEPHLVEGHLWRLVVQALDPWDGGRSASETKAAMILKTILARTESKKLLHAWFAAASREGSQSELELLRRRMVSQGIELPSGSNPRFVIENRGTSVQERPGPEAVWG